MTRDALVTGSDGFLGRHFARHLTELGWTVWPMTGNDAEGDVRSLHLDVDSTEVYDLVVHCAAVGPNRVTMSQRQANVITNVNIDSALLGWAIETDQRHVLYVSSSAIYPRSLQMFPNGLRLEERHAKLSPLDPDGMYGWTKWVGELMCEAAREQMGLNVTIVRPFSGYGEDQDPDHFPFPAIVRRVREHDYTVWGPPGQTRDWIHVDDVVRGALAAVEANVTDPVNLCTGVGTDFGQLVQYIRDAYVGDGAKACVSYDQSMPTGVLHRVGDPTRMLEFYEPKVTLEEGIRRAVSRISGVA